MENKKMELDDAVHELARHRKALLIADDAYANSLEILQATYEHIEMLRAKELRDFAIQDVTEAERIVRDLAVMKYQETEQKEPHPAVKIAIYDEAEVKDETAAKAWANDNLPEAVKLDVRKLLSATKKLALPFLERKSVPKAKIASDLSQYE